MPGDPPLRDDTAEMVAFLPARLDEDEQVAREVRPYVVDGRFDRKFADHLVRHDPSRVLREVEAKRRIVDEHWAARGQSLSDDPRDIGYAKGLIRAIRLLASAYADHPDYREEWKP